MYVYMVSEPSLWTVGFYQPDGVWQAESDHATPEEAAERAAWLNGGRAYRLSDAASLRARLAEAERRAAAWKADHDAQLEAHAKCYEALKAIQQAIVKGELNWKRRRRSDADPYHQANVLMCAAIAKAEHR